MQRLPLSSRNDVHVEIGNSVVQMQIVQSRFFRSLTKRCSRRLLPCLEMAAHLQPAIEATMMMQQQPALRIDDETARGDVARIELIARIRGRRVAQEIEKRAAMTVLDSIKRLISVEGQIEGNHW